MKTNGLIDKKGLLLDKARAMEIRRQESELKMIGHHTHVAKHSDFNLKDKLNQQLNHLANRNLIM